LHEIEQEKHQAWQDAKISQQAARIAELEKENPASKK
jgi:hypothetical protein